MDGSLQSQDDDDPPPANPADTGAASPTQEYEQQAQAHAQALKKEKGRVRFNSSAAANNPFLDSAAVPGLSSSPGGDPTVVQKPKPSILRAPKRHEVVESETAAAAAAQQRAQERARQVAAKVKRESALATQSILRLTPIQPAQRTVKDYIIKLCRALMLFGAPTHRLEEYLSTTANILEIDGQFLYLPGCMIISFDDRSTHTTEVRIVRSTQGIDLGRLKDTHHIYKEVIHDVIGAEAGSIKLDDLMKAKDKFHAWLRVLVFGLTSATAAPFSFSARLIDLPLAFCFGCLVGTLQLIVAPMSMLYSNVLEVSATVLVSFLARAFGSIRGGDLFCFSALAQSGIVMLLPGYAVLCSALELQSRAIVPGSIRIVYAVIYSLFLGFGITVGAALYGILDDNATSETTCRNPIDSYYSFIFVPLFVVCISMLYQAKWKQMPVMVVVASAGYIVNFFSGRRFVAAPQIANTLGALAVGVLANLYSRIRHGVAAATLIPAIFTQVPGGLASTGGLLSGLSTANMITNSSHEVNGTGSVQYSQGEPINTVVFNVAASMIQIAIGIAVGLFISALIIYPLGKRRSGLFSF
ncbi:pheromone-regulated membrane protein [Verticillium alfalfae VaMs.102]|uniref:Pheromone-regulated membrane protein n=1 Tax=Verticillium alfalfae (strain VaMs.102 / ATCC MYA-4576 / FGSC 10136) TaxID=526221 RepID=C9SNE9_VERA1|nr:pheromone-regulated membrane protein [Verticillium alfalfae VaMs.102]EEY20314.1 pheromone-regulated membrane protein [Verticillium alfalfae VaMs.102]